MASPARLYGTLTVQLTSTGTSDVQSHSPAEGITHVLLSAETNDARFTFDGSTPSSSNGHVLPKAALPLYLPVGKGSTIKFVSTAAGSCQLDITDIAA